MMQSLSEILGLLAMALAAAMASPFLLIGGLAYSLCRPSNEERLWLN